MPPQAGTRYRRWHLRGSNHLDSRPGLRSDRLTFFRGNDEIRKETSFAQRLVIVANHTREFPNTFLVLPQVNKFCLPHRLDRVHLWPVETMYTHLDSAIAVHGIHLECPRNQFPAHFAADVFLH